MQKKMLDALIQILNKKDRKKIILLHINADADAVGSAYALSRAFPNITVGVNESIAKTAKRLAEKLKIKIVIAPQIENFESVFVLDTSTPEMLGKMAEKIKFPLLIDHHAKTAWKDAKLYYCDENKSSCAEIVYEILKKVNFEFDKSTGIALLTGIVTDSGRFRRASAATFLAVADIMERAKIELKDILAIVEEEIDMSERIALLKAAQRLKYLSVGKRVIAYSVIGAFEGTAAAALLSLGADIAVVGSQKNNEFVVIAKATEGVPVHLGNFMNELGKEIGASGGGHAGAAGITGKGCAEAVVNICVEKLKANLTSARYS